MMPPIEVPISVNRVRPSWSTPGEVGDLVAVLIGAVRRPRALPVPTDVDGDDVKAVAEVPREPAEGLGARRVSVHAHYGRGSAIAPVEVVKMQAAHHRVRALGLCESCHRSPPF